MKFIIRTNKKTGLVDKLATIDAVLTSIETKSRTNSNGKPFGFINAVNENGDRLTGIAYNSTAMTFTDIGAGSKVVLETEAKNIAAGENNKWQLALPVASAVDKSDLDAAAAFLAQ